MKQILVPTDFSENAQKAYPFALNIASKTNSAVTFLLAIEQPFDFAVRIEEKMSALTDYAHTQFQNLMDELKKKEEYAALDIDFEILKGRPASAINKKAKELDAGLIVMGSKGVSAFKKILFGSVTTSVITDSPVPVMLIPEDSTFSEFRYIIFTTEYREHDIKLLQWVSKFATNWRSKIDILHIAAKQEFKSEIQFLGFREKVLNELEYDNLEFSIRYADDFFEGVRQYQSKNQPLLVMGRYEMRFLDALFNISDSTEMAGYSSTPLLVLPAYNG